MGPAPVGAYNVWVHSIMRQVATWHFDRRQRNLKKNAPSWPRDYAADRREQRHRRDV